MFRDLSFSGRNERGDSLVEILITLVILGVGVAGLVPMLLNTLSLSDRAKKNAKANQIATVVVDSLARTSIKCDYASFLNGLVPLGSQVVITAGPIKYWDSSGAFSLPLTACFPTVPAPPGSHVLAENSAFNTQLITVNIQTIGATGSPDGRGRQTIEMVKRR